MTKEEKLFQRKYIDPVRLTTEVISILRQRGEEGKRLSLVRTREDRGFMLEYAANLMKISPELLYEIESGKRLIPNFIFDRAHAIYVPDPTPGDCDAYRDSMFIYGLFTRLDDITYMRYYYHRSEESTNFTPEEKGRFDAILGSRGKPTSWVRRNGNQNPSKWKYIGLDYVPKIIRTDTYIDPVNNITKKIEITDEYDLDRPYRYRDMTRNMFIHTRKDRGLTLEAAAALMRTKPEILQALENGERKITEYFRKKFYSAYQLTPSFIDGARQMNIDHVPVWVKYVGNNTYVRYYPKGK